MQKLKFNLLETFLLILTILIIYIFITENLAGKLERDSEWVMEDNNITMENFNLGGISVEEALMQLSENELILDKMLMQANKLNKFRLTNLLGIGISTQMSIKSAQLNTKTKKQILINLAENS